MKACARLVCLLTQTVLLAGCAMSGRGIDPGESREIFDQYRVQSQASWSRTGWRNVEIWTVDGPLLQQLRFYRALEDGQTLFERPIQAVLVSPNVDKYRPKYRVGMDPHEVAELVSATMMQFGAVSAESTELRPAQFGGRPGFRFRLQFISQGGLVYAGLVLGHFNAEGHLHLVLYLGARDHYFPKLADEVEHIFASLSWK